MKRLCYLLIYLLVPCAMMAQMNLQLPSDNALNQPHNVTFKWQAYQGSGAVMYYNLQLSSSADFTSPFGDWSYLPSVLSADIPLAKGTVMYWRVVARFGNNVEVASQPRMLTTADDPQAVFSAGQTSTCANNTIDFSSAGSSAYTYAWTFQGGSPATSTAANPSVTYTTTGTFSVSLTVTTALGSHTTTKNAYITITPAVQGNLVVAKGQLTKCANDTVTLKILGGAADNTYLWSTGSTGTEISVTDNGIYTVQIVNNRGCVKKDEAIVSLRTLPLSISLSKPSICRGDSVLLIVDGGFSRYVWSTGATIDRTYAAQPGYYTVSAYGGSNGCNYAGLVYVPGSYASSKITKLGYSSVLCREDSVVLIAPPGFTAYRWDEMKHDTAVAMGISDTLVIKKAGSYRVVFTDSSGCAGSDLAELAFTRRTCIKGIKTIGGSNPDFVSVKAAMDSLNLYGIAGKTTFRIRSGTYRASLLLQSIAGASAVDDVTFESETGIAETVVLTAPDSLLLLNNVSYVSFRNLSFSETVHERLLLSKGRLSNIRLQGNKFTGRGNSTFYSASYNSDSFGFDISAVELNAAVLLGMIDSVSISNNVFSDLFYPLYVDSSYRSLISGNRIGGVCAGIVMGQAGGMKLSGNTISLSDPLGIVRRNSLIGMGIQLYADVQDYNLHVVERNKLYTVNTDTLDEMYLLYVQSGRNIQLSNNSIFTYFTHAVYIDARNVFFAHNNLVGAPALTLLCNTSDSVRMLNNILAAGSASGIGVLQLPQGVSNAGFMQWSGNVYHIADSSAGRRNFRDGLADYATYTGWKAAQLFDAGSRLINPGFVLPAGFQPSNISLYQSVSYLNTVPADAEGKKRGTAGTAPGAYELLPGADLAIDSLAVSPVACSNNDGFMLRIRNAGVFSTLYRNEPVRITVQVDARTPQMQTYLLGKDSLPFRDTTWLRLPTFFLGGDSTHRVFVTLQYAGDSVGINDTLSQYVYTMSAPAVDFSSSGHCAGNITFTALSNAALSYQWTFPSGNAATAQVIRVLPAGSVQVGLAVVGANGCSNAITKAITIYSLPDTSVHQKGDSLLAVIGMRYQWYFNNSPLANDTLYALRFRQAGIYYVKLTNVQGCEATSSPLLLIPAGVEEEALWSKVAVYPVPASDRLYIDAGSMRLQYKLVNMWGQEQVSGKASGAPETLDLSRLATGVYLLHLKNEGGDVLVKKVVIRN